MKVRRLPIFCAISFDPIITITLFLIKGEATPAFSAYLFVRATAELTSIAEGILFRISLLDRTDSI